MIAIFSAFQLKTVVFKNLTGLEYVEILLSDTANNKSRQKRQLPLKFITYILHTNEETTREVLENLISEYNISCLNKCDNGSFTVNEDGFDIASDSELCTLRGKCDPTSTVCNNTNGRMECVCKTGFERKSNTFTELFCTDIDECHPSHQSCPNAKNCTNTIGNWTCTCENGFEEFHLNDTTKQCKDKCLSKPCKNGAECVHGDGPGLIYCKCPSNFIGPYCQDPNPQVSTLDTSEASKFRTILIAVGASLGSICLLLLIVTCRVCRRNQSRKHEDMRPLSSGMNEYEMNENKGTFQIPRAQARNEDERPSKTEDKPSTYLIPRAQVRDDRIYSEIEGEHEQNLLDETSSKQDKMEKEPLQKSTKEVHGGEMNRSFLHEEAEKRRSLNPGKNGVDYF